MTTTASKISEYNDAELLVIVKNTRPGDPNYLPAREEMWARQDAGTWNTSPERNED